MAKANRKWWPWGRAAASRELALPSASSIAPSASATTPEPVKKLKRSQAKDAAYTQPSTRVYQIWTPKRLKRVERNADTGNMRELADLCDRIGSDDRVKKALGTVVGGLLSLQLTFEASGDGRRRGRAQKALEVDEDWWAAFPESELQQFLSRGLLAGVSFAQLRWESWKKGRLIPKLEPWELHCFRYDVRTRQWWARTAEGEEVLVTPGDGRWVVYTPYGSDRPWANGLWRGIAPLWLLKQYAISDSGRHGEKAATWVAKSIPSALDGVGQDGAISGTVEAQREELADQIAELGAEGVIVLPNGFDLALLEVRANTERIYATQWEFANTSIDIAIQGQNLTSEVKEGSRAAADVHGRVEARVIRFVGSTASATMHDQAVTVWAAFNFGDPNIAPWPTWDTDIPEDTKASAEGQKAFGEAVTTIEGAGFEIENIDELADKYGLKLKRKPKPNPALPVPGAGGKDDPDPPEGDDPDGDEEDEDASAEQRARRTFVAALKTALASGAKLAENRGFIDGQLYIDAVVDYAVASANAALAGDTKRIQDALDAATDVEDLRARLRVLFAEMSPEEISDQAYKAQLMAELAGIGSVTQDA